MNREELKNEVEQQIKQMLDEGIQKDDFETLGELVDIHKDIANEEYWEKKKEVMDMNYRESGNYGNYRNEEYGARRRDSRERYMERGRGGNYRGHEIMDDMYGAYDEYSEGREEYGRGNYGAKENTLKSLEYMLESVVDFFKMLKEEASSQQEIEMIKHYAKKISEM